MARTKCFVWVLACGLKFGLKFGRCGNFLTDFLVAFSCACVAGGGGGKPKKIFQRVGRLATAAPRRSRRSTASQNRGGQAARCSHLLGPVVSLLRAVPIPVQ